MTEERTTDSQFALFTLKQIVMATALGGPIAGCLLLARNYRVLGNTQAAGQSIAVGVVATIGIVLLLAVLPQNAPITFIPLFYAIGMWYLAEHLQGKIISAHVAAGGKEGGWSTAIALGIGCLVAILALVFGVLAITAG